MALYTGRPRAQVLGNALTLKSSVSDVDHVLAEEGGQLYRVPATNIVAAGESAPATRGNLGVRESFDTVALLQADTLLAYSANSSQRQVTPGDIIEAGGFRYQVAASDATDHHLTTAGGVKLKVTGTSVSLAQFGNITTDEANVATVTAAWLALVAYGAATGAEIIVPPTPEGEYWPINYPAQAYSGMRLRMDGHIRNIRTSASTYGNHFCIFFGTCDANSFQNMDQYDINDVSVGDSTITFDTAGDSANFAVGDIVVLMSAEGDTITGSFKPLKCIMNEVIAVGSGTIDLLYPAMDAVAGSAPVIVNASQDASATISLDSIPCRAVKDVTVYGAGGFSSGYERWTGFGGCLRPNIQTRTFGSVGALAVNALAHGFVDVWGTVYNSGLEIAWGSHDLLVQSSGGLHFAENPNGSGISDGSVFYANEHARRITFDNIHAYAKGSFYVPSTAAALSICHDCVIGGNVEVHCDPSLYMLNIGAGTQAHSGHRVGRAKFYGDSGIAARTRVDGGGSLSNVILDGTEFHGTYSGEGLSLEGADITARNVYHESGNVLIRSGSTDVKVIGCESDSYPTITDSGTRTEFAGNYIRAICSAGGLQYRDGQFQRTLADDTAFSIPLPSVLGQVSVGAGAGTATFGMATFNSSSPAMNALSNVTGASMNFTTGVLAGTTSTDTRLNVSVHTDGRLYVENRLGTSQSVRVKFS